MAFQIKAIFKINLEELRDFQNNLLSINENLSKNGVNALRKFHKASSTALTATKQEFQEFLKILQKIETGAKTGLSGFSMAKMNPQVVQGIEKLSSIAQNELGVVIPKLQDEFLKLSQLADKAFNPVVLIKLKNAAEGLQTNLSGNYEIATKYKNVIDKTIEHYKRLMIDATAGNTNMTKKYGEVVSQLSQQKAGADRLVTSIDNLQQSYQQLTIEATKYNRTSSVLFKLREPLIALRQTTGGITDFVTKTIYKFNFLTTQITQKLHTLTLGFIGVVGSFGILKTVDDFEKLDITLRKLTSSADDYSNSWKFLLNFAKETPLTIQESTDAFVKLKAYGLDPLDGSLEILNDTMAALGGGSYELNNVVRALGQIQAKGRLMSQELRQLADANIPVFSILKEELGLTSEQIENIGRYSVSASSGINAILTGLKKSFGGTSAAKMDTLSGRVSNLKDIFSVFFKNLLTGAGTLDFLKGKIVEFSSYIEDIISDQNKLFFWSVKLDNIVKNVFEGLVNGAKSFFNILTKNSFVKIFANYIIDAAGESDNLSKKIEKLFVVFAYLKSLLISFASLGVLFNVVNTVVTFFDKLFLGVQRANDSIYKQKKLFLELQAGIGSTLTANNALAIAIEIVKGKISSATKSFKDFFIATTLFGTQKINSGNFFSSFLEKGKSFLSSIPVIVTNNDKMNQSFKKISDGISSNFGKAKNSVALFFTSFLEKSRTFLSGYPVIIAGNNKITQSFKKISEAMGTNFSKAGSNVSLFFSSFLEKSKSFLRNTPIIINSNGRLGQSFKKVGESLVVNFSKAKVGITSFFSSFSEKINGFFGTIPFIVTSNNKVNQSFKNLGEAMFVNLSKAKTGVTSFVSSLSGLGGFLAQVGGFFVGLGLKVKDLFSSLSFLLHPISLIIFAFASLVIWGKKLDDELGGSLSSAVKGLKVLFKDFWSNIKGGVILVLKVLASVSIYTAAGLLELFYALKAVYQASTLDFSGAGESLGKLVDVGLKAQEAVENIFNVNEKLKKQETLFKKASYSAEQYSFVVSKLNNENIRQLFELGIQNSDLSAIDSVIEKLKYFGVIVEDVKTKEIKVDVDGRAWGEIQSLIKSTGDLSAALAYYKIQLSGVDIKPFMPKIEEQNFIEKSEDIKNRMSEIVEFGEKRFSNIKFDFDNSFLDAKASFFEMSNVLSELGSKINEEIGSNSDSASRSLIKLNNSFASNSINIFKNGLNNITSSIKKMEDELNSYVEKTNSLLDKLKSAQDDLFSDKMQSDIETAKGVFDDLISKYNKLNREQRGLGSLVALGDEESINRRSSILLEMVEIYKKLKEMSGQYGESLNVTDFTSSLSDMRDFLFTNLGAVSKSVEEIKTEKVKEMSDEIQKAKEKSIELENQLIELNKIISGLQRLEIQPVIDFTDIFTLENHLKDITNKDWNIEVGITEKVSKNKFGGFIKKFASGGFLGGYGGGDRIKALLEAGEFVVRKEAVKKFGVGFFEALNGFSLPKIVGVEQPAMAFANGGSVPSLSNFGTINLNIGNSSYPVLADKDVADKLIKHIKRQERVSL